MDRMDRVKTGEPRGPGEAPASAPPPSASKGGRNCPVKARSSRCRLSVRSETQNGETRIGCERERQVREEAGTGGSRRCSLSIQKPEFPGSYSETLTGTPPEIRVPTQKF